MPKTILIVEDDVPSMSLASKLLEANGFDTLQSADGLDVLQLARGHHPDLILMDIQLPEVSGIDHIKALKADQALRNIPVVAVTAIALKQDEENIRAAGCDAFIAKPINISLFLETIARILD